VAFFKGFSGNFTFLEKILTDGHAAHIQTFLGMWRILTTYNILRTATAYIHDKPVAGITSQAVRHPLIDQSGLFNA
jgi:hypothetical protein